MVSPVFDDFTSIDFFYFWVMFEKPLYEVEKFAISPKKVLTEQVVPGFQLNVSSGELFEGFWF